MQKDCSGEAMQISSFEEPRPPDDVVLFQNFCRPDIDGSFISLILASWELPTALVNRGYPYNYGYTVLSTSAFSAPGKRLDDKLDDKCKVKSSAAIVPWNFPLYSMVVKVVHAVLAGNTVVCKPSPFSPYTGLKFVEFAQSFFPPPGVINVLSGDDISGQWMTSHPGIDKVSFTGSTATGRKVMESCSKTLKRVTLELGGKDAAIILADADITEAVAKLGSLAFINSSQVCTTPKRIYVHASIAGNFIPVLVEVVKKLKVGDGMNEEVAVGPLQNEMQYQKVPGFIDSVRKEGGEIVVGGRTEGFQVESDSADRGFFVEPTIVVAPGDKTRIMREEQFGPILPVTTWRTEEEVIQRANDTEMGLGASVWSADIEHAQKIGRQLEAGSILINDHVAVNPLIPFGGWKGSGIGVENGREGLMSWCNLQCMYIKDA
ncbi:Omega-crystallin [Orbilia brochopaga]|nr:Omega-crystallin [Drechslerella brochopaga]